MGRVREMIKNQVEAIETAKLREEEQNSTTRASITMPHVDNRRAEYAAKYLGMSKSSFIASVVNAALVDFEEEVGIKHKKSNYAQYYVYMSGSDPIEDYKFAPSKGVESLNK